MNSVKLQIPDCSEGPPTAFPGTDRHDRRGKEFRPRVSALRRHYRRPLERPFTEAEREKVTVLVGGLTQNHERFIRAVFHGCGYNCEILPTPDQDAFHIGKEYGNNGQCSPAYFTAGSLIQYLKNLESRGMSRSEIADRYVFFTAGSCGPCRFGMYAAEYRLALQNAGFDGFRVIRFQQDDGVMQKTAEPGLRYTVNFGMGMLNGLYLGDALNDLAHNLRPYEVIPGETDRVMELCIQDACRHLRDFQPGEVFERLPSWLAASLARRKVPRIFANVLYKLRAHLYGKEYLALLEMCRTRINNIELDRTRIKPIVKIIGEFWAQTTEGDGNYRMFEFLEREGAHVLPEAIGTWLVYLLTHARLRLLPRRGLDAQFEEPQRGDFARRVKNELEHQKKMFLLACAERIYAHEYHRVIDALGGSAHRLVSARELAALAEPYYDPLARGGEGYLEVGKNIYYTAHKLCHMVLSLKPFGCMPSSQSDGIQSAVVNRFKDMIFLPIETSGEGETNAHSRVQMALGEAKFKAKAEYQETLAKVGKSVGEVRAFVAHHPELKMPLYHVPRRAGTTGVAANFIFHVSDLMAGRA